MNETNMPRKENQVEELNRKHTITETKQCVLGETGNEVFMQQDKQ